MLTFYYVPFGQLEEEKVKTLFVFHIIEIYLNLVDMGRKIIYLWIPGDGNIVVD